MKIDTLSQITGTPARRELDVAPPTSSTRLRSLDALRGFDMFWIMGGDSIFTALAALTGWPLLKWWAGQLEHVPWHGFHAYDMIFPLFLFIAGISFPFSVAKHYAGEADRKALYRHVITRGLLLVLLGIITNNKISFDFPNLRYGSVLGRIGLAWMCAALIFIHTKRLNTRIVWLSGILLSYWALLLLFPAHDLGATDPFSMQGNLAGHIDRLFLPGKFCCYIYGDSEGILSAMPAIGTALLGMLTGQFVMSSYLRDNPLRKVLYMAAAAVGLITIGAIWNLVFPINKYLWSSSFVCFVGGLSLLLFELFYLVIDVWQFTGWTTFFAVIGMNSIAIYMAKQIIDFSKAADYLFGGVYTLLPAQWHELALAVGYFVTAWLFLFFLYKKKLFFKV